MRTKITEKWADGRDHVRWEMKCGCGETVRLDRFTNTCNCGREYNMDGSLLAPRSQWGEETGETAADIELGIAEDAQEREIEILTEAEKAEWDAEQERRRIAAAAERSAEWTAELNDLTAEAQNGDYGHGDIDDPIGEWL